MGKSSAHIKQVIEQIRKERGYPEGVDLRKVWRENRRKKEREEVTRAHRALSVGDGMYSDMVL